MRSVLLLALLNACTPPPKRAFYYWRTTAKLAEKETAALAQLHIDRVYVRLFDVDEQRKHVAPLRIEPGMFGAAEIVPVVFIRNEALSKGVDAAKIWREVATLTAGHELTELQIDCDWTESTRAAYFALLLQLHPHVKTLSTTIRLHQVKYRERTGVPPADRGMLMFYNMGSVDADQNTRAIFDAAQAERYLSRVADYPLPLDAALPLWSWVSQIRDGHVVNLLQTAQEADVQAANWMQPLGNGRYQANETSFFQGALLRAGDVLEVETTRPEDTHAAAALLAPKLKRSARTISLFDLSERNISRHDVQSLDRVFAVFH